MTNYRYLLPLTLCGALALAACGTAQKDWTNASTENSVSGYQAFLDKHPKDEHAQEAQTRIAALQDDAAWKTAQSDNSSASYQAYLQAQPNGTYAQAARDEIAGFDRANAWKTAQSDGSAAALRGFFLGAAPRLKPFTAFAAAKRGSGQETRGGPLACVIK